VLVVWKYRDERCGRLEPDWASQTGAQQEHGGGGVYM
jgi:hypothetical protein